MPKKSFSIYNSDDDLAIESTDRFVIESGRSHLAIVLTKANRKSIKAFELFDFDDKEAAAPQELYSSLLLHSKLLGKTSGNTHVYINNQFCIPVPIFKFNKEIAADYLDIVFGEENEAAIQFEHLPIEPGIMNVFRVSSGQAALLQQLPKVTYHHTYSNVIWRHAGYEAGLPDEFISVQFYSTYFVAIVLMQGRLYLIQTFVYEYPEDVLYYLLNICDRFGLYSSTLTLQISGMIDLEFKLYRELIKYFKQVTVDNTESILLPALNEHPPHYFTPFFHLAV